MVLYVYTLQVEQIYKLMILSHVSKYTCKFHVYIITRKYENIFE